MESLKNPAGRRFEALQLAKRRAVCFGGTDDFSNRLA